MKCIDDSGIKKSVLFVSRLVDIKSSPFVYLVSYEVGNGARENNGDRMFSQWVMGDPLSAIGVSVKNFFSSSSGGVFAVGSEKKGV